MSKSYVNVFAVELLENYTTALSEKLGITPKHWNPIISTYESHVLNLDSSKRYCELHRNAHIMKYEDDCIKLCLTTYPESSNCVELYWLEIKEKCKGRGTEIMNTLLDTADEMNIQIRVLPVDFDNSYRADDQKQDIDYLKWLRSWYKSFGFIGYNWKTPALMYYPNK